MSKPNRKRIVMQQVRAKYVEAVGGDQVDVELDDGTVVVVPHPMFADDAWKTAFDKAEDDHDRAVVALGDQYDTFAEHGGDDGVLNLILIDLQREMQDVIRKGPEAVPTTSSTSSENTRKPSKQT